MLLVVLQGRVARLRRIAEGIPPRRKNLTRGRKGGSLELREINREHRNNSRYLNSFAEGCICDVCSNQFWIYFI